MTPKGLGRKHKDDPRDRIVWQTPYRIAPETVTRTFRYWDMAGVDARLDQGSTGHCVGFGCTAFLYTGPVTHHDLLLDNAYGHELYYLCKQIDGEPNNEDGTYVRSGMKALVRRGLVGEYLFAHDLESVVLNVLQRGPVVIGVDFYESMYEPDEDGFMRVHKSSGLAGGHCMTITGVSRGHQKVRLLNSWSKYWANNGHCFMSFTDLATLLADDGEMALAIELSEGGTT